MLRYSFGTCLDVFFSIMVISYSIYSFHSQLKRYLVGTHKRLVLYVWEKIWIKGLVNLGFLSSGDGIGNTTLKRRLQQNDVWIILLSEKSPFLRQLVRQRRLVTSSSSYTSFSNLLFNRTAAHNFFVIVSHIIDLQ